MNSPPQAAAYLAQLHPQPQVPVAEEPPDFRKTDATL